MPRLKDIVNSITGAASDAGRAVTKRITKGAEIANDTGKAVLKGVDKATKPARDFAEKAGTYAKEGARSAGKLYLEHRERVDAGMMAYPVGQTIAQSAVARAISTKLLGLAGGAIAVKAAPIIMTAAAIYYGRDIVKKAEDFLKQGDTMQKARKGDAGAIKDLADTIAAVAVHEKPESKAGQAIEDQEKEARARAEAAKIKNAGDMTVPSPANTDKPPPADTPAP